MKALDVLFPYLMNNPSQILKQASAPAPEGKSNENFPIFELPGHLEASEPPEKRGLKRDEVRLMISQPDGNRFEHTFFRRLSNYLGPNDVLVINTSATLNAALSVERSDGKTLQLHLSTELPDGSWAVELRQPHQHGSQQFFANSPGDRFQLPAGGSATLLESYDCNCKGAASKSNQPKRLWKAKIEWPEDQFTYLQKHGFPIRYDYIKAPWPIDYYQTVFATEPGSAEMPSAGRAFTPQTITQLIVKGVEIIPILLHTGVASLEADESPYQERYRISADSVERLNTARQRGKRIIAVGTTVVRALETAADQDGILHAGEGYTCEIITPQRGVRVIDGLLTGFHEPKASHLKMLSAIAGREHLKLAYAEALRQEYLWHEFGDMHLILP